MRAVWLSEFGPPEVLVAGEAPDPVAGDGQVVIDVAFAGITFVETQLRAGRSSPFSVDALPMIPGNGVGGTVVLTGEGVDPGLAGTRVVSATGGSGGYAERVAVEASGMTAVPDALDLADAVALLADGRTALLLAERAELEPGERVLVEAAAGGVGSLLVQLAAAAGATVVAAAGGGRKLDLARGLGADVAVDYRSARWTHEVREAVGAVDVVFDGVGGDVGRSAFGLVEQGGRMLRFGAASGSMTDVGEEEAAAGSVTLTPRPPLTPERNAELVQLSLGDAAVGCIRPIIGQRFPLEEAAAAHAAIEARVTVGKTLLVP